VLTRLVFLSSILNPSRIAAVGFVDSEERRGES